MKKSIFGLSYAEGKQIEKELKATSYGKSFLVVTCSGVFAVIIIFIFDFLIYLEEGGELFNKTFIALLVLAFFFQAYLRLKWMQLIKVYYDEKNDK